MLSAGFENFHVASGGHLADVQALHFAFAHDVDHVLAGRRDRHALRLAGLGQFFNVHVLRAERRGRVMSARI